MDPAANLWNPSLQFSQGHTFPLASRQWLGVAAILRQVCSWETRNSSHGRDYAQNLPDDHGELSLEQQGPSRSSAFLSFLHPFLLPSLPSFFLSFPVSLLHLSSDQVSSSSFPFSLFGSSLNAFLACLIWNRCLLLRGHKLTQVQKKNVSTLGR